MNVRLQLLALGAAAALALGACGDDEEQSGYAAFTSEDRTAAPAETTAEEPSEAQPAGDKPKVAVPSGAPPAELEIEDLKEGAGAAAEEGDSITVQYVGVSYSTKKQFDASWDRGEPFTFTLGAGDVIQGWDQGVAGMKVGGRRQLIIPPDLGYGAAGQPPDIKPNETLVFVIDLVSVE